MISPPIAKKLTVNWLLSVLALFMICFPGFTQQPIASAPLSADELMERVVEMNSARAKALESYSSLRTYHLECHCLSRKKADMTVRINYQAPDQKEFTIL